MLMAEIKSLIVYVMDSHPPFISRSMAGSSRLKKVYCRAREYLPHTRLCKGEQEMDAEGERWMKVKARQWKRGRRIHGEGARVIEEIFFCRSCAREQERGRRGGDIRGSSMENLVITCNLNTKTYDY